MKKTAAFFSLLALLLWAAGLMIDPPEPNMRSLMHEIYYVSGLIAWIFFTLAVISAAKPSWLTRFTKGSLSAVYASHRPLAIGAVLLSLLHWASRSVFSPLAAPFATDPVRKIVRHAAEGGWDQLWSLLRPFSVVSSDIATVLAVILASAALFGILKNKSWHMTLHRVLFSVLYLVLSVHVIRLSEPADFLLPFGWLTLMVTAAGIWASCAALLPHKKNA